MIRTLLLILLMIFIVMQFTGGIGRRERSWPSAICWDLTPNFGVDPNATCAQHDGVLIWLKVFGAGDGPQYQPGQYQPGQYQPGQQFEPAVPPSDSTSPQTDAGALDPSLGVVFPAARARDLTTQCSRSASGTVQATWDPDAFQIQQLEQALSAVLLERLAQTQWSGETPRPGDYYRQYAGVVINGRQLIYVNGFHKQFVESTVAFIDQNRANPNQLSAFPLEYRGANFWQGVPVMVCDGGAMFFGAEYDPATGQFVAFQFNGAA